MTSVSLFSDHKENPTLELWTGYTSTYYCLRQFLHVHIRLEGGYYFDYELIRSIYRWITPWIRDTRADCACSLGHQN
jgi:hypothetical protein